MARALIVIVLVLAVALAVVLIARASRRRGYLKADYDSQWEVVVDDSESHPKLYKGEQEVSIQRVIRFRGQEIPVGYELVERIPPGPFQESAVLEARGKAVAMAREANSAGRTST